MPSDDNLLQTQSSVVEGILSFDCVIGSKNCIYNNRTHLAQGKMAPQAKSKLISTLTQKLSKKPLAQSKVS